VHVGSGRRPLAKDLDEPSLREERLDVVARRAKDVDSRRANAEIEVAGSQARSNAHGDALPVDCVVLATGRRARSFDDWVRRNAAAFR
jgi:hypothetical protein